MTLTRRNILRSLAALPIMGSARAFAQQTDSIAALVASTEIKLDFQGKLSTRTGIVADKRESAMVTSGSLDAMQLSLIHI